MDYDKHRNIALTSLNFKIKHPKHWQDEINEAVQENKKNIKPISAIKYKHAPYYCNKCETFHKYIFHGRPSITHKKHFKHIYKYKSDFSQSELFKLSFKKGWKQEKADYYKKQKKESFINESK